MTGLCINNAMVWDGQAAESYLATVVISGNQIEKIIPAGDPQGDLPSDSIDATGMSLMPGLVEGHCHPSFTGINTPEELGVVCPERHMLETARNLRLLLSHGFTSIFEAASAKPMIGVTARDAINEGLLDGPRMLAGSPEMTTTAGLGDERKRHLYQESFGLIADGPDEFRRVSRECIRDGVDVLKINISGDEFVSHARAEITPTEEAELEAVVKVAHAFGKKVAAHARSSQSVKMAVKAGVDCIYHCDFADEEALDMLEEAKDRIWVGPAFGLVHNSTKEGEPAGITKEMAEAMNLFRKFEATCATYHEIRKRGIRVVVGGDYGFAVTPMGQNARDIEHFVRYFGYSPVEALQCATVIGQSLMGQGDVLGQVSEGYLADLLLVRGDVTQDVSLLQHQDNLAMIMKDGVLFKDPRDGIHAAGLIRAAE
ncbi:amidohydrolase family protein [Rhodophyticola sp. CCM32]|uniref:metal-dependent hydrolase family protein n=1 Tax=Rhodophyticola sp. CCM32 TaxID=2916397 RepID=UPI00107F7637|nr:amidohydrolase family protein [Rhodophyticola sp. CCM32]QBY00060.1 amidohydrolase family protein [Rhodophyticola sp. CCM32]